MSTEEQIIGSAGEKATLLGNEAIARGVLEAGVQVVAAYPGTPSSEIVDSLSRVAKQTGQYVEWSTNEKVAFECAAGAAFLGVRSFSAMKSVGLNVAMDPLMVITLTGINGGFVIVVADDPNCWSTQNEQDSRLLAQAAEVVCLEPSSPQEAKDMVVYSYRLSEEIGRLVMIRTVTRLNHCRGQVTLGPLQGEKRKSNFVKVMSGFPAVPKHKILHREIPRIQEIMADCPFNKVEVKTKAKIGVIASGNAANYAREAISALELDETASFFKLGVVNPLPEKLLREFLVKHETIVVFEEIEPFVEEKLRSICYEIKSPPRIIGKVSGDLEIPGELTREKAIEVLSRIGGLYAPAVAEPKSEIKELLVERSMALCAGCPHMGAFYAIRKACRRQKTKVLISGDIGCYGLLLEPPYRLFDSHICMGASIGIGNGYSASGYEGAIVCVIGDSTFYHSGISGVVNAVFNQHDITVVVLDNAVVGMTGHQPDPGTGVNAMGKAAPKLDIGQIAHACGVQHVAVIDPFHVDEASALVKEAISFDGPSVVISRGACALLSSRRNREGEAHCQIDGNICDSCGICVNLLNCPALTKRDDAYAINEILCFGCGICAQVCPKGAIK